MIDNNVIKKAIYETFSATMIEQIIIFGSKARGDSTADSDTDICVITKEELSRDLLKSYRYELNKLFAFEYRVPVDILIKSSSAFNRYKNVVGAIEYNIAAEGVQL